MIEPPLVLIGAVSIGFVVSNTIHTVSARRNKAAGVSFANANVTCRPSLSRIALTVAPSSRDIAGFAVSGIGVSPIGRTSDCVSGAGGGAVSGFASGFALA